MPYAQSFEMQKTKNKKDILEAGCYKCIPVNAEFAEGQKFLPSSINTFLTVMFTLFARNLLISCKEH